MTTTNYSNNVDDINDHDTEKRPLLSSTMTTTTTTSIGVRWSRIRPQRLLLLLLLAVIGIGAVFSLKLLLQWNLSHEASVASSSQQQQQQPQQTVIVVPDYQPSDTEEEEEKYDSTIASSSTTTGSTSTSAGVSTVTMENKYREPEILVDKVPYRAICEYYSYSSTGTGSTTKSTNTNANRRSSSSRSYDASSSSSSSAPPRNNVRIIQTSLHQANEPWSSVQPCIVHPPNTPVQLNVANTPDAILQVNFTPDQQQQEEEDTVELKSSSTTSTSTSSSSSSFTSTSTNTHTKSTTLSANRRKMPTILGFGGAFTPATTLNFQRLSYVGQQTILDLYFGINGLGYSMGRVPIHSCDFSINSYTYDDYEDDFTLQYFDKTLQPEQDTIQLIIRAVQTYRHAWTDHTNEDDVTNETQTATPPPFKLIASPWSPPAWMKRPTWEDTNLAKHAAKMTYSAQPNCLRDGVGPKSTYAKVWAQYVSKYITSYQTLTNISFWAVTVQNEPEFAAPWEACSYTALNMTDFVAYHLGPTLQQDHPLLHILAFDHNKDHVNHWMLSMLNSTSPTHSSSHDSPGDKMRLTNEDEEQNNDNKNINNEGNTSKDRTSALTTSSRLAAQYISGTAYHWYAGGTLETVFLVHRSINALLCPGWGIRSEFHFVKRF
jgi:O-glycosyl hydrolase